MKYKIALAHMHSAFNYAELSYCEKKKVGCVIVKENRIISIGYNGTPPGWANCCEDKDGKTLPHVYHAEANAIAKLACSPESGENASVFITCSPCIDCAKLLAQIGVKEVYYAEEYKSATSEAKGISGLEFLERCGVRTLHLPKSE